MKISQYVSRVSLPLLTVLSKLLIKSKCDTTFKAAIFCGLFNDRMISFTENSICILKNYDVIKLLRK